MLNNPVSNAVFHLLRQVTGCCATGLLLLPACHTFCFTFAGIFEPYYEDYT